jgi:predicted permease
MGLRRTLSAAWRTLFRRAARERELDEELRFHLEAEAEERRAEGLSAADALLAARRDLGSQSLVREAVRDEWGWRGLERFVQDIRYGVRVMARTPGQTAAAVLSLALGIGANTAVFSLVDLVTLRALPVADPERLVIVAHRGNGEAATGSNLALYETLRDGSRSFAGLLAFFPARVRLRLGAESEAAVAQYVTPNYFAVLGVRPLLGRAFDEADHGQPIAVISHGLWQRRFGGAADVVGRALDVNGVFLTIAGVTPPEFFGLQRGDHVDAFLPLPELPRVSPDYGHLLALRDGTWNLAMAGRLQPGVAASTARAEVEALVRPWIEEVVFPETGGHAGSWAHVELLPGRTGLDALRRRFSQPLSILLAIVGAVLLISCANVAALLLSRAATRRAELVLRAALGAGRWRLVRQLLTESLLLAALGGLGGLALAVAGARALVALVRVDSAAALALTVEADGRVLAFTAVVSLLTAGLVGLAPAFRATRIDLQAALNEGGRGPASDGRVGRWRQGLIAGQVALCMVLVVGAGLFVRSLSNIRDLDPGFDPDRLLLVEFDPQGSGYPEAKLQSFYEQVLARANTLPGVRAASLSALGPLTGDDSTRFFSRPGFTPRETSDSVVHVNAVTPGYFHTMGVPLLDGRTFREADGPGAPRVAILGESAARFYFAGTGAVGQVFSLGWGADAVSMEVIGVARDIRQRDVRESPSRMVYLPCAQRPGCGHLQVRTAAEVGPVLAALPPTVRSVAVDVPILSARTTRGQVDASLGQERLIAIMSSLFGALALTLAAVGLYGVVSHAVTTRTREFGIRMALGAGRRHLARLVMREAGAPVLVGAGLGLLAAVAVTRAIAGLLFGLAAHDPATFLQSLLTVFVVAVLAAVLPARRALRTPPAVALRSL